MTEMRQSFVAGYAMIFDSALDFLLVLAQLLAIFLTYQY